jgi:hypothetical protein
MGYNIIMGRKRLDLVGRKFGKLEVISFTEIDSHQNSIWKCLCECGNTLRVKGFRLTSGKTKSCNDCNIERKKKTLEEWKEIREKAHGDFYEYLDTDYKCMGEKVEIICPIHGKFFQLPTNHAYGKKHGCPECKGTKIGNSNRKTEETWIEDRERIHGNFYEYPDNYVDSKTKIGIICPIHGEFMQSPSAHIHKGYGCSKCGNMNKKGIYGYLLDTNQDVLMGIHPSFVYLLRLKGNNEEFYKVGVAKDIKKREKNWRFPYNYEFIEVIETGDMLESCLIERSILSSYERYIPNFSFNGKTECFII